MNTLLIPIEQIDPGRRLRPVDQDYARLIGASMAERGQMTPIEVRAMPKAAKPYILVAGAHRLAGAEAFGIAAVAAVVFDGSALEAELREIDENLIRHELKELDRAAFLAKRKEVYERLHPETKHGAAGKESGQNGHSFARFTAEAAARIGFSERTIRRSVLRFGRLDPEARALIACLWIADHGAQLDALSKLEPELQRQVAAALAEHPRVLTVAAAVALVAGARPVPRDVNDVQFDAFLRLWKRMGTPARRRVRAHINRKDAA